MNSFNAILLLDYLGLRKKQQETHLQILKNEAASAERSYNLLFSHFHRLNRSSNQNTETNRQTTDFNDEMTGILSSISNFTTRRSTPSLATRSTINRSTNTSGLFPTLRTSPLRTTSRENITRHLFGQGAENHRQRRNAFTWPISAERHFTTTTTTFDDTPPPPTPAEIEIATISCKFSDISTNQIICPITRSTFIDSDDIIKIIHCNHIFKKNFLLTWFQEHNTCPVCRYNITQNRTPIIPNLV